MEIQKIHMVVYIFSGFALFTELMWVHRRVDVDRQQGAFWFTNKRVQIRIPSVLKVVLFESIAGNDFSERRTQAEAHCERNLNSANCEVLDEKHRMIAFQGIFVGIIIKASGTTLKLTDLLFAFAFCKK